MSSSLSIEQSIRMSVVRAVLRGCTDPTVIDGHTLVQKVEVIVNYVINGKKDKT